MPTLTATAASSSQVNLSWTAATDTGGSGLAGYRIYRSGTLIATIAGTSYSNTGLSASTSYCYTVAAYDNSGNASAQSTSKCATTPAAADTAAPSVPTLTATAASSSQINLSWTAAIDTGGSGLAGYRVYRSGTLIATTAGTSYSNTGLSASTSYCYTVAAYDNAGNASAQSTSKCATTPAAADTTAPTVSMTSPSNGATVSGTISLAATASDNIGVTKVEFYRSGVSTMLGSDTTSPYSVSFDTTTLSDGSYSFYAKAYDAAGNTKISAVVSVSVSNGAVISDSTWLKQFGGSGNDLAYAVAGDSAGNLFTAGGFTGTGVFGSVTLTSAGSYDIFISKSGSDGTLHWVRRFGGTGGESPKCIALDSAGNIYIGGSFTATANFGGASVTSSGGYDAFIAKYSSSGAFLWSRTWGGVKSDVVNSLALDAHQGLLVTGYFQDRVTFTPSHTFNSVSGDSDTILARYSVDDGSPLWAKTFANIGSDMGVAVMVDSSGNIFLAGQFGPTIDLGLGTMVVAGSDSARDIYVAKFPAAVTSPPSGSLWADRHGGPNQENLFAAALDANGNLAVAGNFWQQTDLGSGSLSGQGIKNDMFLAKYSGVDGSNLWARKIACYNGGYPRNLRFDPSNNLVLCGYYDFTCNLGTQTLTSAGSFDIFAAKFAAATGNLIWAESFGGASGDDCYGVAVDSAGYSTVVGCFSGTANFGGTGLTSTGSTDAFLIRLEP